MPLPLAREKWFPVVAQSVLNDKDRLPEILSRISAPTTAGVVFGVGATSARMEADRKTQLNLRRIAMLLIASPDDTFAANVGMLEDKLIELLTATPVSAPSSSVWAEVFMVLRAIVLKTDAIHVAPLWPVINKELQRAILSVVPTDGEPDEKYNNAAILQACKVLDTLLTLEPDDFQLYEWLYITDTIDTVYRPPDWAPISIADEVAEALGEADGTSATPQQSQFIQTNRADEPMSDRRKPVLDRLLESLGTANEKYDPRDLVDMERPELVKRILRPFFGQLSLLSFESTYACVRADTEAVVESLVRDLFDEGSSADT